MKPLAAAEFCIICRHWARIKFMGQIISFASDQSTGVSRTAAFWEKKKRKSKGERDVNQDAACIPTWDGPGGGGAGYI